MKKEELKYEVKYEVKLRLELNEYLSKIFLKTKDLEKLDVIEKLQKEILQNLCKK